MMSTRALLPALLIAALIVPAARAQLTNEDIERLRQRGQAEGWTFTVELNDAIQEYSIEQLSGAREPDGFDPGPRRVVVSRSLPERFDWREHNGVTPVQNQGGCGSCWAFSAMGAAEGAIRVCTGNIVDLSEQWLVSCTDAGSCSGGWHSTSLAYMTPSSGSLDYCNDNGAVRESDMPYIAVDGTCGCPYPRPYLFNDYGYVGDDDLSDVPDIKQAILDYGPVSACIRTSDEFGAYSSGVFNHDELGFVTHCITLVGWDDAMGTNGVWILKNSWGAGWGMAGYMYIEYGVSSVGYRTYFADYDRPDCNNNGIPDFQELALGDVPDCNGNNVPDACDIAAGTCVDCDGNGLPDSCELAAGTATDCNINGILDACDLSGGTSTDCNANGLPDDCDIAIHGITITDTVAPLAGWLEIAATGTALNLGDDGMANVTLPFASQLLGGTTLRVHNNGAIGVVAGGGMSSFNAPIPDAYAFGGAEVLFPYWDDLDSDTGNVYWQVVGFAPARALVVEWKDRPHRVGDAVYDGDECTFQAQIFETPINNVFVQYVYQDTDFLKSSQNHGASASIGYQTDGTHGVQWCYNVEGAVHGDDPYGTVLSIIAQPPTADDANGNGMPDECETSSVCPGDGNCDGFINFRDIDYFVAAQNDNVAGWQALFDQPPACSFANNDCNDDGYVNFRDIDPFVALQNTTCP